MEHKLKGPRGGMIVALCVVLTALWLVAVYGTYKEEQREKYDVHITPGAVSYGTHSTALTPAVVAPARTSIPMVSGGAVRSYAHSGHATMPATATSSKGLYTTSSAKVKTIGSGGASGGGMMTSSTTSGNSQRGINYGSTSVSIPMIAMATPTRASSASANTSLRHGVGPRRMPGSPGEEEGDEVTDSEGTWMWDGEQWILINSSLPVGTTKIEGGRTYRWNGSSWDDITDQIDPGLPVGATPWLMMMLLACAYAFRKYKYKKTTKVA